MGNLHILFGCIDNDFDIVVTPAHLLKLDQARMVCIFIGKMEVAAL